MNLVQLLLILKARWRWVAALTLAGLLIGVAWVALTTRMFQASTEVLVTVRAPNTVAVQGDQTPLTSQLQPDYLTTQVDVIKSDRTVVAVVKQLHLDEDPQILADYRASGAVGSVEEFAANRIRGNLFVSPSPQSRVIRIGYVSPNPELAATFANAFAKAYTATTLALQIEPARESSDFYKQSASELRTQLQDAINKLSQRRTQLGITAATDASSDAEDGRLNALQQQLATAQATQSAAAARAGQGALPDAMTNSVVQGLLGDIAKTEAQRAQLATFAGPNNVDYKQLTNQLATLRSELAKQKALVAQSANAGSAQSSANVAGLQGAVNSQRDRVLALQQSRGEIASLEQDVNTLKSTYEQLVARQAQSTLLGGTSQTNISILSPASVPTRPAGVPLPLKVVAATLGCMLLGIVLAVISELLDQRLRRPEDAEIWLAVPNLGGVRAIGRRQNQLAGRVMRYLPGPSQENSR